MGHRRFTAHPLALRALTVMRTSDVTPRMRRITLGGPELGAFERAGHPLAAFTSPGFDDHVKLVLAGEGPIEAVLPTQLAAGIEWVSSPALITRDYTPRRVTATELDLDFVLHASGGEAEGPAERWARAARPGDVLHVVGPKSSTLLPDDVDRVLLVGDETALPAIGRFFDERPTDAPVHAIIAIADDAARQPLATAASDRVDWVLAAPGDPAALADAVLALDDEATAGSVFAWGGAEARALLPIRRHLARTVGVPKSHTDLTGYWHRTAAPADDTASGDAEQAQPAPHVALPDSPVRWFAIRAALRLGILDALDERAADLDALARAHGVPARAIAPLLRVLADAGLVAPGPDGFGLTSAGAELVDDEHGREHFEGHEAEAALALAELDGAFRQGVPAWQLRHGETLATQAASDPAVAAALAEETAGLAYLTPALVALPLWTGARVGVGGPGAAPVIDALGDVEGAAVFALGADVEPADVASADVVVLARTLEHRTDAESLDELARVATAPLVVVIERARADELDPEAAEDALARVAVSGTGPRSADRLAQLAREVGFARLATHELGWGIEAIVFGPSPTPER
ncbi:siderophore-interacting protein [Pseudoclavibacter chungangensis]|uniref:Siderophore-interacting protein n=2 Tax=Pseudoclavibacter chungangensis TaxID=587635 RepID=A0A7J5BPV2_9MICO|nr:siderophore-interacting protein [Pseudoclavibacter chungangensis]